MTPSVPPALDACFLGPYGENDKGRSMAIRYDDSALATQLHPIGRVHPETGQVCPMIGG